MSFENIRVRMNEVQANITAIRKRPDAMFESLLQEKLGALTASDDESVDLEAKSTSVSGDSDTATYKAAVTSAAANTQVAANAAAYNTQNQLNLNAHNNLPYATAYGSNSAAAASAYCAVCAQQNAAYTQNYGYNNNSFSAVSNIGLSSGDLQKAEPYMQYVNEASQRYGMPVNLILGIMKAESDFNNECVSYAGAKGLMQLMPETAAEVGVTNEFDPRQNILGSVEYVTKLINRYDGDVRLALAAYNTGPGKIARRGVTNSTSAEYLTVPQSIRDYADRVLRYAGYQD